MGLEATAAAVRPVGFAAAGGGIECAGLLVVATVATVLFGGVEQRHLAPLQVLVFGIAGIALGRRVLTGRSLLNLHPTSLPLLGIVALGVVQLIPLPTGLTHLLSPGMTAVRADLPGGDPAFLPLSVYPYATELALLQYAAYTVFFLLALDSLSSPDRVRAVLLWASGLGTLVALYGLLNYLSGNTSILWLPRRYYLDSATGTLINRNHFATLMVLLLPSVLACYLMPSRGAHERPPTDQLARGGFFALCAVIIGLGLLFSKSRAGIVSGVVSLAFLVLVLQRSGGSTGRVLARAPLVIAIGVLAAGLYIGLDGTFDRFLRLVTGVEGGGRRGQWADTLHAVGGFPLLGSGLGTYEFLYPMHKTLRAQTTFAHAHNDYLELLSNGGIVGLGLGLWAIGRFARIIRRVRPRRRAGLLAWTLTAGIAGMGLHSLVDFGLQIPGNMFCLLLLAAAAIRIAETPSLVEPGRPQQSHRSRTESARRG